MKVIQKYLNNPLRNFNYIIYSEETKAAIFIDPLDISKTLPLAENLNLIPKYLLNTHHHPDHIGLAGWLCEKYGTEMICSRTAYLMAKMLSLDVHEKVSPSTELFWRQAGMSPEMLGEKLSSRPFNFGDGVHAKSSMGPKR